MDENKEIIENTENEENTAETAVKAVAEETVETKKSAETESEDGENDKLKSFCFDVLEILESTLITVFIIVMIFTYILHPVNIVGRSMVPTLNNNFVGERMIKNDTDKVFMNTIFFDVEYGDILVIDKDKNYLLDENNNVIQPEYDAPINECIIKRVIAVGGQTIDIQGNQVVVDGEVIDEPYIAENSTTEDMGAFTGKYPVTVPDGYYFVMGDNRNHSTDSRARSVGFVKKDQIYGKAIIKYSPLDEFDILIGSHKG